MGRASGSWRPRRRRKPCTVPIHDPLGLEGFDIRCETLKLSEMSSWFDEIAVQLDKRWALVEKLKWKDLAAKLEEKRWRIKTQSDVEIWREEQRQDHEWRLRLLDGNSPEGKLYSALCRLSLDNMYFRPDPGGFEKISDLLLTMLDLMEFPDPFRPPELRTHVILPGTTEMRPEAQRDERGALFYVPQDGIVLPRRYSRERAYRAIRQFMDGRDKQYWKDVKWHARSMASESVGALIKHPNPEAVEKFFGQVSMTLIRTLRYPMLNLFECMGVRAPAITKAQTKRASARYDDVYRLVKRLDRTKSDSAMMVKVSDQMAAEFRKLRDNGLPPKEIALTMIIDDLELSIGPDALWRHIREYRKESKLK